MTTTNGSNVYREPWRADAGQAGIGVETKAAAKTKKPRHLRGILSAASFRI
jgi:hypothetical protein